MWGSNPRPWAHKTHALPTELNEQIKAILQPFLVIVGFEPTRTNTLDLKSSPLDHSGK